VFGSKDILREAGMKYDRHTHQREKTREKLSDRVNSQALRAAHLTVARDRS
jgi:hypothetical protein